jgi:hypothetical protein
MKAMHVKPLSTDWSATATAKNCVIVKINDDLSIEDIKLKVLGENRQILLDMKPASREISICTYTGTPTFVELVSPFGTSIQYVENSGTDRYPPWDPCPN